MCNRFKISHSIKFDSGMFVKMAKCKIPVRLSMIWILKAAVVLYPWTYVNASSRNRRRISIKESPVQAMTINHGRRDNRGRVLSVASHEAVFHGNLFKKLEDDQEDMPLMAGDRRSVSDGGSYGGVAYAAEKQTPSDQPVVELELQLMPDEEPMVFDLVEQSENPGHFTGLRNPESHPVDQETFGEINLISNSNGHVAG